MGKSAPYLKHDANASYNSKLMSLLRVEKVKGYGVYWLLLETLRLQPGFKMSMSEIGTLAYRCKTRRGVMNRVICDYGLFVVENNCFYSPGLCKRLKILDLYINEDSAKKSPHLLDKPLIINEETAVRARIPDHTIPDQRNNSLTRESVRRVLSMEESVSLLTSEKIWCEDMARISGHGVGFLTDLPLLLPSFVSFLRLRGEEYSVNGLSDAKRRFLYWMKSDDGKQAIRKLHVPPAAKKIESNPGVTSPNRYETLLGGQRTYLGRPIPADAPPRPDAYAVWDDQTARWTR